MKRIEKWFINRILYEMENPGFPNLILGILAAYYLVKWEYQRYYNSKSQGETEKKE